MNEATRLDQARSGSEFGPSHAQGASAGNRQTGVARRQMGWRDLDRARNVGQIEWSALALMAYDLLLICWFAPVVLHWVKL